MRLLRLGRLQLYWDGWTWWKDFSVVRNRVWIIYNLGPLSFTWHMPKPINHP